ncbi:MAG: Uma2 family endonuclease [Catalinimonas sp.]
MPSTLHSYVQINIGAYFRYEHRVRLTVLSELGVELSGVKTVPDLAVYDKLEIDFSQDVITRTDAPLLTVEILSPIQALQDLTDKTDHYLVAGVRLCWVVLPPLQAVVVYHAPGQYTFFTAQDVLKDQSLNIELPLTDIFR